MRAPASAEGVDRRAQTGRLPERGQRGPTDGCGPWTEQCRDEPPNGRGEPPSTNPAPTPQSHHPTTRRPEPADTGTSAAPPRRPSQQCGRCRHNARGPPPPPAAPTTKAPAHRSPPDTSPANTEPPAPRPPKHPPAATTAGIDAAPEAAYPAYDPFLPSGFTSRHPQCLGRQGVSMRVRGSSLTETLCRGTASAAAASGRPRTPTRIIAARTVFSHHCRDFRQGVTDAAPRTDLARGRRPPARPGARRPARPKGPPEPAATPRPFAKRALSRQPFQAVARSAASRSTAPAPDASGLPLGCVAVDDRPRLGRGLEPPVCRQLCCLSPLNTGVLPRPRHAIRPLAGLRRRHGSLRAGSHGVERHSTPIPAPEGATQCPAATRRHHPRRVGRQARVRPRAAAGVLVGVVSGPAVDEPPAESGR